MNSMLLFLLSSLLLLSEKAQPSKIRNTQITVMGIVYCDTCLNNTFSTNSYFLPGVEVRIDCTFKAISPRTTEQIEFSGNRTTNKHGVYRLEIPAVDGIECARDKAIGNSCSATLLRSRSPSCAAPGYRTTSQQIAIKSQAANLCIYSLTPLNFRPPTKNINLCGN